MQSYTLKTRCGGLVGAMSSIALALSSGPILADGLNKHAVEALGALARDGMAVGAYDPHGILGKTRGLSVEHVYLPWRDVDLSSLIDASKYAEKQNRKLLITVEPWTWSFSRKLGGAELHRTIMSGQSDGLITSICKSIGQLPNAMMVRFGQEMDLKNDRYPWSNWTPDEFIGAYRHFVDKCREHAPKVKFMWSPRGEQTAAAYFPGKSYVDAIGLSIFAHQPYDEGEFGRWRKPSEIIAASYQQLSPHDIDVWAVELGCSGNEMYRAGCFRDLFQLKEQFPKLQGAMLFNALEPHAWPKGYGRPDWRIGPVPVN